MTDIFLGQWVEHIEYDQSIITSDIYVDEKGDLYWTIAQGKYYFCKNGDQETLDRWKNYIVLDKKWISE